MMVVLVLSTTILMGQSNKAMVAKFKPKKVQVAEITNRQKSLIMKEAFLKDMAVFKGNTLKAKGDNYLMKDAKGRLFILPKETEGADVGALYDIEKIKVGERAVVWLFCGCANANKDASCKFREGTLECGGKKCCKVDGIIFTEAGEKLPF